MCFFLFVQVEDYRERCSINMEKEIANISNGDTELSRETTEPGSVVKDLTLWQTVRRWRKTVLYCLGLSSGTLLYGYDLVIVGTVTAVPAFQ